jgi:hypothetical protein
MSKILPTFYTIICETPPDPRAETQGPGLFSPEFEIPTHNETILDVIERIKEQLFPVAYVLRGDTDVTELIALEWFRTLVRDGWVVGAPVPEFIWRHVPASVDLGYRQEIKE